MLFEETEKSTQSACYYQATGQPIVPMQVRIVPPISSLFMRVYMPF